MIMMKGVGIYIHTNNLPTYNRKILPLLRISQLNLCKLNNMTLIFVMTIEYETKDMPSRVVFIRIQSFPDRGVTIIDHKDDKRLIPKGGA